MGSPFCDLFGFFQSLLEGTNADGVNVDIELVGGLLAVNQAG